MNESSIQRNVDENDIEIANSFRVVFLSDYVAYEMLQR